MTRKIHTSRPSSTGGRIAWDEFTKWRGVPPMRIWYTHLSYWCWVAEWEDGETDDIDSIEIAGLRGRYETA